MKNYKVSVILIIKNQHKLCRVHGKKMDDLVKKALTNAAMEKC